MSKTANLPRPSLAIRNEALRPTHRRIALATVWLPFIGTLAALALLPVTGFGALEIGLLAGGFILTNLGIEFGFHRSLAHKAFETYPAIRTLFAILGSMAAEGRVLHWVADHRRHHAHSDTSDDPHSPHVRRSLDGGARDLGLWSGLWHAHIGHMLTGEMTNGTLFARDLYIDPAMRRINQLYTPIVLLGLFIPAVIGAVVTQSWQGALSGFLWGGMVRMFLLHHTTWSVASLAHRFGYTVYETGDRSVNNVILGLLSFGSGYQNNHHAFPRSAYLGLRWWELDVTGLLVFACSKLGLVWKVQSPSERQLAARRLAVNPG